MKLKTDISFMKLVESDDTWQRDVLEAGDKLLCIVDVYSETWGPCEMVSAHFSNYFFDLGDDYGMRFVRAKADKIAALKDYRGKARPNFLFYLAGEKVEELDGADLPKIQKTILEKAPKTS